MAYEGLRRDQQSGKERRVFYVISISDIASKKYDPPDPIIDPPIYYDPFQSNCNLQCPTRQNKTCNADRI